MSARKLAGLAFVALLAAALPADSAGAVCQLQTSGDWGPVSVFTGAHELRVPRRRRGDRDSLGRDGADRRRTWCQSALPGQPVRVLGGGTLRVAGGRAQRGRGPLERGLHAAGAGLRARARTACSRACTARSASRARAPRTTLASAGFLSVGEVVPCPGWDDSAGRWAPDCAGALTGDPATWPVRPTRWASCIPRGAATTPPVRRGGLDGMARRRRALLRRSRSLDALRARRRRVLLRDHPGGRGLRRCRHPQDRRAPDEPGPAPRHHLPVLPARGSPGKPARRRRSGRPDRGRRFRGARRDSRARAGRDVAALRGSGRSPRPGSYKIVRTWNAPAPGAGARRTARAGRGAATCSRSTIPAASRTPSERATRSGSTTDMRRARRSS